jgi:Protein of unknown function (DUF1573).
VNERSKSNGLIHKFKGSEKHTDSPVAGDEQAKRDEEVKKMPKTLIAVSEPVFDFGKITDGDIVRHVWEVKNVGHNPLLIASVQTSCGCTAPSYSVDPILPGKSGIVELEFNSAGRVGKVQKNALIIANADNAPFSIGFTAEVLPKP